MIARRSFLTGLVGLMVAPAIVRIDSLMKLPAPKRFATIPWFAFDEPGHGAEMDMLSARFRACIEYQALMLQQQIADCVFASGSQWPATVRMRLPQHSAASREGLI